MSRPVDLLGPKSDAVRGAQLLLQSKNRRARRQFLAEGPQAVNAALAAALVQHLYVTEDLADEYKKSGADRIYLVTDAGLRAISETEHPSGVVAVVNQPDVSLESVTSTAKILVAAEISDPGNLGTMIRTAAACGYDYVITTSGSTDMWSGKVVRSTAGMFTEVGLIAGIAPELLLNLAAKLQIPMLGTTGAAALDVTADEVREILRGPHMLFIGNEAHGLSDLILQNSIGIRIPMADGVESLNAAVAAAICMYAAKF